MFLILDHPEQLFQVSTP